MTSNIIGDKLSHDPKKWVDIAHARANRNKYIFISIFVVINIAVLFFTMAITLISIFGTAGIFNTADGKLPDWYPRFPIFVNAIGGFLLSLVNFMVVRPRYVAAIKNSRYIRAEKLLFDTKTHDYALTPQPALLLAQNVAKYIGYGEGDYS